MTQEAKSSLFKQLLQRRVFQIVGIYLGAIVAMMEFTGMVVERYGVSDHWVDLVLAGMVSFIPAVLILAWRHGAPGKDEWGKAEKIGVPLNGLVTLALLISIASSQTATVSEPALNAAQVTPPEPPKVQQENQQRAIRRIGVLFFDGQSGHDNKWVNYALSYLIATHLGQERNLISASYYQDVENSFFWQVKRAGFTDGLNLPQSLARNIAQDSNFDYFTRGTIAHSNEKYQVSLKLFETKTNKEIASVTIENDNLFEVADAATQFLKQQKQLIPQSSELINEIPINDLITANEDALRSYIEALNNILFHNDYSRAIEGLNKTVAIDPSYALAYLQLAELLVRSGKIAESKEAINKALQFNYKLTERTRFLAKAFAYALDQKTEQQMEVYRTWMEFYPDDYWPRNQLAFQLIWKANDLKQAAQLFEESLTINPAQNWIYSRLGELYLSLGDLGKSEASYQLLSEKQPTNFVPFVELGNIEVIRGNLSSAKRWYQKAALLRTDKVTPVLSLAELAIREGRLDDAVAHFDEARGISQAPRQQGMILAKLIDFYSLKGEYQQAYQTLLAYQELAPQYMDPMDAMFAASISRMHLYVLSGHSSEAQQRLEAIKPTLDEQLVGLVEFGYLFFHIAEQNKEQAYDSLGQVEQLIIKFDLHHLGYMVAVANGWIEEMNQDYQAAAQHHLTAVEQLKSSAHRSFNSELISVLTADAVKNLRLGGNIEQALKVGQEFLKEWPYHPDINYQLAEIYFSQNNLELARDHLNKTLSIWQKADDDFLPAQKALQLESKLNVAGH